MSRYRKIDPRFWKDEKIVKFCPEEKLLALYLFTGQSNRIGIFTFSPGEAAEDLGMLPQTFGERFANVCQTLNLGWDETFRVLYIPTWWKYNPPENSNNVIGNLKDLDEVPNSPLVALFVANLEHLPETLAVTFTQTLAKRYPKRYPKRSPSQEQEQEQDIEKPRPSRKHRRPSLADFQIDTEIRSWCSENDISASVAEAELPKFKDWHLSKGNALKDVAAAFRNWLRKNKEFHPSINGRGGFVG